MIFTVPFNIFGFMLFSAEGSGSGLRVRVSAYSSMKHKVQALPTAQRYLFECHHTLDVRNLALPTALNHSSSAPNPGYLKPPLAGIPN